MTAVITPDVYFDLPADVYHADPALSYSGAKLLLPPSTPAHYRYDRDHPRPPKRAFDLGHAAHRLVLGAGADLVDVDAADYRTKAAQQAREAAYDDGKVPLLPKERHAVEGMAAAILAHPLAGRLFSDGEPEVSLFWTDPATGCPLRCRLDWLPFIGEHGRVRIVPDLKTRDGSVHAAVLGKVVDDFRYFQQAAFYIDGLTACGLASDGVAFVFVFVEATPPHLVQPVQLGADDLDLGRALNRRAIEIYRDCTESGIWPGHPIDIPTVTLPTYARRRHEETIYEH